MTHLDKLSTTWCNSIQFGTLAHWRIGALGQLVHLGHWRISALAHWGIGALAHWDIGPMGQLVHMGHWRIGALAHCGIRVLGSQGTDAYSSIPATA